MEQPSSHVHVPPCDNSKCQERLSALVEKFQQVGIQCEHKYKPCGLYKSCFDDQVARCQYTILHVCPHFYRKLSQLMDVSSLQQPNISSKCMCVAFFSEPSSVYQTRQSLSENVDHQTFFLHFIQSDISDANGLSDFVQYVYEAVVGPSTSPSIFSNLSEVSPSSDSENVYQNTDSNELQSGALHQILAVCQNEHSEKVVSDTGSDPVMQVMPDIFGHTIGQDVFVLKQMLLCEKGREFLSRCYRTSWNVWIDALAQQEDHELVLEVQTLVLQKVLPYLFQKGKIAEISHFITCKHPVIQQTALTLLELVIFRGGRPQNKEKLKEVELLVQDFMEQKRKNNEDEQRTNSPTRNQCQNLVLLLQHEYCVDCLTQGSSRRERLARFHRMTQVQKAQKLMSSSPQSSQGVNYDSLYQNIPSSYESDTIYDVSSSLPPVKKILGKSKSYQIAVTVEMLKKIFQSMDMDSLRLLKEYLSVRKGVPVECVTVIVYGLTLFLSYELSKVSDRNIHQLCFAVMEVLSSVPERDFPLNAKSRLHLLIFDKTPVVRQAVLQYVQDKMSAVVTEQLLLIEISRLISPLLSVDLRKKVPSSGNSRWTTCVGRFYKRAAILLFHVPEEQDLNHRNQTQFINFEDKKHIQEIQILRRLQHPVIIELFTYQEICIPHFYVIEDYITNELQMALKNRNDNKKYFDHLTLVKFILCAIEGLEYCHDRQIVHRNLTAKSLFLVGESSVKLGGFCLAFDLNGWEEVTMVHGSSQIPTRWSAQESLRKLRFSKQSDVYMFGSLMYEILTHGSLPYSHLNMSNDHFVEKITSQKIHLVHEPCIKKETFQEIQKCLAFFPQDRPDTSTLRKSLITLSKGKMLDPKARFPSLSDVPTGNMRQPSSCFQQGTPEYEDLASERNYVKPIYMSFVRKFSQCRLGEGYLFHEEVGRKFSQQLLDQLNTTARDILPSCMKIECVNKVKYIIDYYIPSLSVMSLMEGVRRQTLGVDTKNYVSTLLFIAETMEQLHNVCLVLGDVGPDRVYLESGLETTTVHIVSWAYLSLIQTFSDKTHQFDLPKDDPVLARAAPEVVKSGLYSPASDIYCLGHLIKTTLADFSQSSLEAHYQEVTTYATITKSSRSYKCRLELMKIADRCLAGEASQRPSVLSLIQQLKSLQCQAEHGFSGFLSRQSSETTVLKPVPPNNPDEETTVLKPCYSPHSDIPNAQRIALPGANYLCSSRMAAEFPAPGHKRVSVDSAFSSSADSLTVTKNKLTNPHPMNHCSDNNKSIANIILYSPDIYSRVQTEFPTLDYLWEPMTVTDSCSNSLSTLDKYCEPDDVYEDNETGKDSVCRTRDGNIYVDATSSKVPLATPYKNLPKPRPVSDIHFEADYCIPPRFPLGYKYLVEPIYINNTGGEKNEVSVEETETFTAIEPLFETEHHSSEQRSRSEVPADIFISQLGSEVLSSEQRSRSEVSADIFISQLGSEVHSSEQRSRSAVFADNSQLGSEVHSSEQRSRSAVFADISQLENATENEEIFI